MTSRTPERASDCETLLDFSIYFLIAKDFLGLGGFDASTPRKIRSFTVLLEPGSVGGSRTPTFLVELLPIDYLLWSARSGELALTGSCMSIARWTLRLRFSRFSFIDIAYLFKFSISSIEIY